MPPPLDTILTPANLATEFVALNVVAFAAFGFDKLAAAGGRRVRESTLLGWAMVGGTIGAYSGRAVFRHKTRKQAFSVRLQRISVLQAVALAGLAGWMLAG